MSSRSIPPASSLTRDRSPAYRRPGGQLAALEGIAEICAELPARRALPRRVRHVTISHAGYCATSTRISAGFAAAPRRAVCRCPYRAWGRRATLRPKGLEADYLATVRGLLPDSVWLHRNNAAVPHPVTTHSGRKGRRNREGGMRAVIGTRPVVASGQTCAPVWCRPGGDRQLGKGLHRTWRQLS